MQAIDRVLQILDIAAKAGPQGPAEMASQMDLPYSTVARLVREMASAGLLDREPASGGYVLGWKLFQLAAAGRPGRGLAAAAVPAMTRLRDQTQETVTLHAPQGDLRICIAEVESVRELRRVMPVGTVQGLIGTTGGEILLAGRTERELEQYAGRAGLDDAARAGFLRRIAGVRERGYSLTRNTDLGVSAISVPVRGADGSVLAALTVSGPMTRFTEELAESFADPAAEAAQEIGRQA
jgi:DNA-binding IclR family transcriptional regulator